MINLFRKIRTTGRLAEPAPPPPGAPTAPGGSARQGRPDRQVDTETDTPDRRADAETADPPGAAARRCPKAAALHGSLQIRHVDAGSCNGCEIEIGAAFGPVYDAERYGARLVASPRHADALLVTGPVTRNMAEPLRRTHDCVPEPRIVVAVGDCARDGGEFAGAYGVLGPVRDVVPVDLEILGCPPPPDAIVAALRGLTGR